MRVDVLAARPEHGAENSIKMTLVSTEARVGIRSPGSGVGGRSGHGAGSRA
jgi:hypothetical protein